MLKRRILAGCQEHERRVAAPMSGSDRLLDRRRYRRSEQQRWRVQMTVLSRLNLPDKTEAAMLTSPEAKLRGKMLEAPDLQIEAAKAMLNGETLIRRAMRWVDDPNTGERVRKEVPVDPTAIRSRALAERLAFDRGEPRGRRAVSPRCCSWSGCRGRFGSARATSRPGLRPGHPSH